PFNFLVKYPKQVFKLVNRGVGVPFSGANGLISCTVSAGRHDLNIRAGSYHKRYFIRLLSAVYSANVAVELHHTSFLKNVFETCKLVVNFPVFLADILPATPAKPINPGAAHVNPALWTLWVAFSVYQAANNFLNPAPTIRTTPLFPLAAHSPTALWARRPCVWKIINGCNYNFSAFAFNTAISAFSVFHVIFPSS
ncbi:MAG: hypothetical protein WC248_02975, partial [Candidatus Methanomethylophilaceae archaeon]